MNFKMNLVSTFQSWNIYIIKDNNTHVNNAITHTQGPHPSPPPPAPILLETIEKNYLMETMREVRKCN